MDIINSARLLSNKVQENKKKLCYGKIHRSHLNTCATKGELTTLEPIESANKNSD